MQPLFVSLLLVIIFILIVVYKSETKPVKTCKEACAKPWITDEVECNKSCSQEQRKLLGCPQGTCTEMCYNWGNPCYAWPCCKEC